MTTPVYALPFASTKAVSPVVVRVGDTKPVVVVTMVDAAGEPIDSAEWTATLELFNAMGDESEIVGQYHTDVFAWYFPWAAAPAEDEFRSEVKAEKGLTSSTIPARGSMSITRRTCGPTLDRDQLAGGGYTTDEAVVAILLATEAVRAWATVPVPSPCTGFRAGGGGDPRCPRPHHTLSRDERRHTHHLGTDRGLLGALRRSGSRHRRFR